MMHAARAAVRLVARVRLARTGLALSFAACALWLAPAHAESKPESKSESKTGSFQFGVIGHSFKTGADETVLKRAIAGATQGNPAFVVATGVT